MQIYYQTHTKDGKTNKGLRVRLTKDDISLVTTKHIIDVWNLATDEEKQRDWYMEAHNFAQTLADETGFTLEQVADFIAAISPQQKWEVNKWKAEVGIKSWIAMLDSQVKGYEPLFNALPKAHMYNHNTEKAYSILAGMEYELGQKTADFSKNIQLYRDTVTIDSLAAMLAVGLFEYGGTVNITPSAYPLIADLYKQAAIELGVSPSHLQAVTWEVCRTNRMKTRGTTKLYDAYMRNAEQSINELVDFLTSQIDTKLDLIPEFTDEVFQDLMHENVLDEIEEYGGIEKYVEAWAL